MGVYRQFQEYFKGVRRMFHGSLKGISRKFQEALREYQGSFMGVIGKHIASFIQPSNLRSFICKSKLYEVSMVKRLLRRAKKCPRAEKVWKGL